MITTETDPYAIAQTVAPGSCISVAPRAEAAFGHQAQKTKRLFLRRRRVGEADLASSTPPCDNQFSRALCVSSGQTLTAGKALGQLGSVVNIPQPRQCLLLWHPFLLEDLGEPVLGFGSVCLSW